MEQKEKKIELLKSKEYLLFLCALLQSILFLINMWMWITLFKNHTVPCLIDKRESIDSLDKTYRTFNYIFNDFISRFTCYIELIAVANYYKLVSCNRRFRRVNRFTVQRYVIIDPGFTLLITSFWKIGRVAVMKTECREDIHEAIDHCIPSITKYLWKTYR